MNDIVHVKATTTMSAMARIRLFLSRGDWIPYAMKANNPATNSSICETPKEKKGKSKISRIVDRWRLQRKGWTGWKKQHVK